MLLCGLLFESPETALEWKLADFGLLLASVWCHDFRNIWQPCLVYMFDEERMTCSTVWLYTLLCAVGLHRRSSADRRCSSPFTSTANTWSSMRCELTSDVSRYPLSINLLYASAVCNCYITYANEVTVCIGFLYQWDDRERACQFYSPGVAHTATLHRHRPPPPPLLLVLVPVPD